MNASTPVKQNRRYGIIKRIDAGSGPGKLEIGTADFAATLASIALDDLSGVVSGERIKLSGFPKIAAGLADGTAAVARLVDSDDNVVLTGLSVALSDADINLSSLAFTNGGSIEIVDASVDPDALAWDVHADAASVVLIDPATGLAYKATTTDVDRELVVVTYRAKNAFTGASVGDTVTMTQIIDVSATPSTVSTIWRNQTTAADLAGAPLAANLEIVGSQALTDAQLRASSVSMKIDQTTPGSTNAVSVVGRITKTDRSGSITAGGSAQTLMAANANRLGWQLQNNSSGDLWFNEAGSTAVAAQPSFKLAPGDTYESPVGATTTTAISIIGATTGQTFTAREW